MDKPTETPQTPGQYPQGADPPRNKRSRRALALLVLLGLLLSVVATAHICTEDAHFPASELETYEASGSGHYLGDVHLAGGSGQPHIEGLIVRTVGTEFCLGGDHDDWDKTTMNIQYSLPIYGANAEGSGRYYNRYNPLNDCFYFQYLWWHFEWGWLSHGGGDTDSDNQCRSLRGPSPC